MAYILGSLGLGAVFRNKASSLEGFLVAGRRIGPWLLSLTFGATYFSSVVIIVGGGWGFVHGLSTLWIAAGNVVLGTLLVFVLLGPRLTRLSSRHRALTVPELLGRLHGSRGLRVATALAAAAGLWLYMVVVDAAAGALISKSLGMGFAEACMVFGLVVAVYIAMGGMYSVIWTDAFQGVVMMMGILFLAITILSRIGGLTGLVNGLERLDPSLVELPGRDITWGQLVDLVLVTSMAVWGLPQLINRFYTAKSESVVKRSTGFAVLFASLVTFSAYMAGAGINLLNGSHGISLEAPADLKKAIPVAASALLPGWGLAVFTAAVTAASMSTMDSIALTASSSLLYDLAGIRDNRLLRIGSAAFTLAATLLAVPVAEAGLTNVFKAGWLIASGAFLVPVLTALAGLRDSRAALASSLTGAIAAGIPSVLNAVAGTHIGFIFPASQLAALAVFAAVYTARHRD